MNLFKKDELLTHTVLMFVAMMVVHLCNLGYQMVVSRVLPPDEYTLLMTFLGVLVIFSRPLTTLNTAINHYVSLMVKDKRSGDIRRLLKKWLMIAGLPGLLFGVLGLLFSLSISNFFHIERRAPVIVTGLMLPAVFIGPVLSGACMGLQLFGRVSIGVILGAIFRLAAGAAFILMIYPACGWALLGHATGLYISTAFFVGVLFFGLKSAVAGRQLLPSLRLYLLQSFFIQVSYAVLMNADIILVKYYFPANETFAYAATIGRMVAFLPMAIGVAMFPKVVSVGKLSAEHNELFTRSLGYTVICVSVAVGGCLLLPWLPLQILFGIHDPSAELLLLTRLMSVAMAFSALLNVVVMFLLAQRHFASASFVIVSAVLYLGSVYFIHSDVSQIAWMVILFNVLGLGLSALMLYLKLQKEKKRAVLAGESVESGGSQA